MLLGLLALCLCCGVCLGVTSMALCLCCGVWLEVASMALCLCCCWFGAAVSMALKVGCAPSNLEISNEFSLAYYKIPQTGNNLLLTSPAPVRRANTWGDDEEDADGCRLPPEMIVIMITISYFLIQLHTCTKHLLNCTFGSDNGFDETDGRLFFATDAEFRDTGDWMYLEFGLWGRSETRWDIF